MGKDAYHTRKDGSRIALCVLVASIEHDVGLASLLAATQSINPMGYNLYITRAPSWLERKDHPISPAEWQAIIDADATLVTNEADYDQHAASDGQLEMIHPTEWTESIDGNCLWHVDGAIECKNPSPTWISKMVEIARRLGAKVLGEEDEEYTA
jgi:hypothetical protein